MTPRTTAFSALTGEQQAGQHMPGTPGAGPSQPQTSSGPKKSLPFRRQWEELKADIR